MTAMPDKEAMIEIRSALDQWFRGQADPYETLNRIAHITGLNANAE